MTTINLNPPETAPKDQTILIDTGLPWLCVGKFNPADDKWVYADLQMSYCTGNEDWWFENEYIDEILGWLPIPEKSTIEYSQDYYNDLTHRLQSSVDSYLCSYNDPTLDDLLFWVSCNQPLISEYLKCEEFLLNENKIHKKT